MNPYYKEKIKNARFRQEAEAYASLRVRDRLFVRWASDTLVSLGDNTDTYLWEERTLLSADIVNHVARGNSSLADDFMPGSFAFFIPYVAEPNSQQTDFSLVEDYSRVIFITNRPYSKRLAQVFFSGKRAVIPLSSGSGIDITEFFEKSQGWPIEYIFYKTERSSYDWGEVWEISLDWDRSYAFEAEVDSVFEVRLREIYPDLSFMDEWDKEYFEHEDLYERGVLKEPAAVTRFVQVHDSLRWNFLPKYVDSLGVVSGEAYLKRKYKY
jgi:hypothetical protein